MEDKKEVAKVEKNNMTIPTDYNGLVGIGTDTISQEDLNTPVLKIIQTTTQGIEDKKEGFYYRSDTKQQLPEVDVNLVFVTTSEVDNYNKTGKEKIKIYYGFYAFTNEPFAMYVRGWGLASHRIFQTEVMSVKNKYRVPMLALTVTLTTEKQTGTIADTGKAYSTHKPVFNIVREGTDPLIEQDSDRIKFLVESANRFAELSRNVSANDAEQNEVNLDDIPDFQ